MHIVSLNGQLLGAEEARISIDERGFRFGDGAFETLLVQEGVPYLLEYHLQRLQAGINAIGIACDIMALEASAMQVIHTNEATDCVLRIYVSRGCGSQGYLPVKPASAPTLLLQLLPMPQAPQMPVRLWLSRWEKLSPRALPTGFKLAQGLNPALARMEAQHHDCYEALQLDARGHISEASSANIFWISRGKIHTPSLATGALAGVTRRRVMELAPQPVNEGEYTIDALQHAEAVFLTNATLGITPASSLEPTGFAWQDSPLLQELQTLLKQDRQAYFRRKR